MIQWLMFTLFLLVGLALVGAGIYYMSKEKHDPKSVRIYRVVALVGVVMTAGSVLYRVIA